MAGITLEIAEARLNAWLSADEALTVRGAKAYRINTAGIDREITSFDLPEVRKQIDYWNGWARRLGRTTGGITVREVIPRG